MIIRKDSWHFKLLTALARGTARDIENHGTSLCPYFWTVVWYSLIALGTAFVVLVVLCAFGVGVNLVLGLGIPPGPWPGVPLACLTGIVAGVFVYFGIKYTVKGYHSLDDKYDVAEKLGDSLTKPRMVKVRKAWRDSLLRNFLKSKHEKFCPNVEVK